MRGVLRRWSVRVCRRGGRGRWLVGGVSGDAGGGFVAGYGVGEDGLAMAVGEEADVDDRRLAVSGVEEEGVGGEWAKPIGPACMRMLFEAGRHVGRRNPLRNRGPL